MFVYSLILCSRMIQIISKAELSGESMRLAGKRICMSIGLPCIPPRCSIHTRYSPASVQILRA